jgi:hypothetical protein
MSTSRHQGLGRREFLTTSACALAAVAAGPELFAGLVWQPRLIVAGFAPLEIESAGTERFERNVIAADRIGAADPAFGRHGVSVSMNGLSGGDPRARRAMEFLAHYTYTEAGQSRVVPFRVWAGAGSPVRFTVPVDEQQRLTFSVTAPMPATEPAAPATRRAFARRAQSEAVPTALPVELSLGGGVSLRRGFYVIVPVYDGQSSPDWSSYSLRRAGARWTLHRLDGQPVSFEHFVVRIDHAAPRPKRELRG